MIKSVGQLYGYGRVGEYRRYSLFLILGTLLLSEKLSEVTKDTGDTYPLTCLYLILDIFLEVSSPTLGYGL